MLNTTVTRRARRLAELSGSLAAILETLPPQSVPQMVQARAAVKLADLEGELEELSTLLGVYTDPQAAADALPGLPGRP